MQPPALRSPRLLQGFALGLGEGRLGDGQLRDPRSRFFARRVRGEARPASVPTPLHAARPGCLQGLSPKLRPAPCLLRVPCVRSGASSRTGGDTRCKHECETRRRECSGRGWHPAGWAAGEFLGASEFPEMFLGLREERDEFPAHSSPSEHLTPAGVRDAPVLEPSPEAGQSRDLSEVTPGCRCARVHLFLPSLLRSFATDS